VIRWSEQPLSLSLAWGGRMSFSLPSARSEKRLTASASNASNTSQQQVQVGARESGPCLSCSRAAVFFFVLHLRLAAGRTSSSFFGLRRGLGQFGQGPARFGTPGEGSAFDGQDGCQPDYRPAQAPKGVTKCFLSSACLLLVAAHGGRALLTHNHGQPTR
jgi:hypothetical protein